MSLVKWSTAFAFVTAGCASAEVKPPNASDNAADYTITFTGRWTAANHPLDYPPSALIGGPHFSGLIGATHNGTYKIIRDGMPPTPGLERLSEEGKHAPLDEEIRSAITSGEAGALIESDGLGPSETVRVSVRVDENHPMVSLVAMIAPSPDWFVGVGDVALWENGAWVAKKEMDLFAWDSGGDDGTTYKADDKNTSPKKPTMLNQSPHFLKDGAAVPVGHLVIERK
jgi:hypothetical protein